MWKKLLWSLLGLVVLLLAFISLWLPGIVIDRAQNLVKERYARDLSIRSLVINPLDLSLEVQDLVLSAPGGKAPFAAFQKLRVAFSPRSLLKLAPIIREAELVSPRLQLIRAANGSWNFGDLVPSPAAGAEPAPPLHFSLNNLVIRHGRIDLVDREVTPEVAHRVRNLEVSLPFIGNFPYLADRYVAPALSAVIDGSPFRVEGRLKPFTEAVEASFSLKLHDLVLDRYLAYLPQPLPVHLTSGRLATDLELTYRMARTDDPELRLAGQVTVTGLGLSGPTGRLVFLPFLRVRLQPANLLERRLAFDQILVYNPEVFVDRDREGRWTWQRLLPKSTAGDTGGGKSPPPVKLLVEATRLRGGIVHLVDRRPDLEFTTTLQDIDFDAGRLVLGGAEMTPVALQFRSKRDEEGRLKGSFQMSPLHFAARVDLARVPLAAYYPYLEPFLTHPVGGLVTAGAQLEYSSPDGLSVAEGSLDATGLEAEFMPREASRVEHLKLVDGRFSARDGIRLGQVSLEGGATFFSRTAEGRWSPLLLIRERPPQATTHHDPAASPGLSWKIDRLRLSGHELEFTDRGVPAAPQFHLEITQLELQALTGPKPLATGFAVQARVDPGGQLAANGQLAGSSGEVKGDLQFQRIPLPAAAAYLPPTIRLQLVQGQLDGDLHLALALGKKLAGSVSGSLGLRRIHALDGTSGQDLLRWERLQLGGLRLELEPLAVRLEKVALSDFQARVEVARDGTLNLLQVFGGGGSPPDTAASGKSEPDATAQAAVAGPDVSIGAITLQGGTLDFRDRHLQQPFATRMVNLGGRIGRLASRPPTRAEVDLRGNLENQSPLRISGELNPLGSSPYLDLKISFKDIELVPTTPYTETYLGYTVDKGKLFLDLAYQVKEHRLAAQNRIFLDQFTFGRAVPSDRATSLPVKLAVALLKDRRGEIHLDLPLSGRTDDPQFSLFGVVLQMLRNLLVKAATAPFSLLASLLGGGEEDFSSVVFPYGSSRLEAPERDKLLKLADAFKERPALEIEISGYVDRDRDPEGFRRAELARKVQMAKYLQMVKAGTLPANASAESVKVTAEEYPDFLKAAYRREDFPKPRNFLGMVKDLPVAEMEKLMLTNIAAGPDQLRALAKGRALAVQRFLRETGGLEPQRLFLRQKDPFQPPAKGDRSAARVEFGVRTQ